jgi:hypothetical protein
MESAEPATTGTLRWIHVSDLHRGQPGRTAWERLQFEFLKDVECEVSRRGVPHFIVATGDIAYCGADDDYALADKAFDDLANALGASVPIFVVPGNHDLVRPVALPMTGCGLRNYEAETEEIRTGFIKGNAEVRGLISAMFSGYDRWVKKSIEPRWRRENIVFESGPLPGDFRATIEHEDLRVGLVGINSAFLHHDGQATEDNRKLAVETAQQGEEVDRWAAKRDGNLLLLHHPPDWLMSDRKADFLKDGYPPRRFVACLHGHMHKASVFLTNDGQRGSERRFIQAPSWFGLEHFGKKKENRVCGYGWGQLSRTGPTSGRLAYTFRKYQGEAFVDESNEPLDVGLNAASTTSRDVAVVAMGGTASDAQRAIALRLDRSPRLGRVRALDGLTRGASMLNGTTALVVVVGNAWNPTWNVQDIVRRASTILLATGHDTHDPGRQLRSLLGDAAVWTEKEGVNRALAALEPVAGGVTAAFLPSETGDGGPQTGLEALHALGKSLLDTGDLAGALDAFKRVEADPEGTDVLRIRARLNMASALLASGREAEAFAVLERLDPSVLEPKFRQALARLLAACHRTGDAQKVIADDRSPEGEVVRQFIALREGRVPDIVDPSLRMEQAQALSQLGNLAKAAAVAREIVRAHTK